MNVRAAMCAACLALAAGGPVAAQQQTGAEPAGRHVGR